MSERGRLSRFEASLKSLPARLLGQIQRERQHLVSFGRHADTAMSHTLARSRSAISAQDRVLQSLSYKNVLQRGFAVIRDENNHPLTRAAGIGEGRAISVEFADGRISAVTGGEAPVDDPSPSARPSQPKKKLPKPEGADQPAKQGTLF